MAKLSLFKRPLPKLECPNIFSIQGCRFCLTILDSAASRQVHEGTCQFFGTLISRMANLGIRSDEGGRYGRGLQSVAMACKMVGGGSDGSLDLCARVCVIDEFENIIFQTYFKPPTPVTNYSAKRYEVTGIRLEMLRDAMGPRQVQNRIQDILWNGEPMWKIHPDNRCGKARILVGHGLDHDLYRLQIEYPQSMIRDTEKYPPLMKTSRLSNSLKYLSQTYLGYDIQAQDPYEDCVAAMRLYLKMLSQDHLKEEYPLASDHQNRNNFATWRQAELERMSPDELMMISRSDYYCWCLDA